MRDGFFLRTAPVEFQEMKNAAEAMKDGASGLSTAMMRPVRRSPRTT
jgi:hypothetical protein